MNRVFLRQVLAWAKQHQQRLAGALAGLIAKQELLETLLAWLQWAETTLSEKDKEVIPQEIEEVKTLIAEHQVDRRDPHPLAINSGVFSPYSSHYSASQPGVSPQDLWDTPLPPVAPELPLNAHPFCPLLHWILSSSV